MKKKNYTTPLTTVVQVDSSCILLNGSKGSINVDGKPSGKDPTEGNPEHGIDAAGNTDLWMEEDEE